MAKRFINTPANVVPELMQGLSLDSSRVTIADPQTGHAVAVRSSLAAGAQSPRVSVVSGGGSGHEPMAAGYVGDGMLAGAVAGDVFVSPSVPAIVTLLEAVAPRSTGILIIVMNYQGDRLNFRMAMEEVQRRRPGYPINMVIVGDDVALPDKSDPRGIAGTIFVLKVAGAAADQGRDLAEVTKIAETAALSIASFGIALEPCTIPGSAVDVERLGSDEIELGMGIHGEPGADKEHISKSTTDHTDHFIASICRRLDVALQAKHELVHGCVGLAIMVNNLGAVAQSEMLIVCKAVADFLFSDCGTVLDGKKYPVHMYSGCFMTSLQMTGVSVSCFMLPTDNGHMNQLLHELTPVTAWNAGFQVLAPHKRVVIQVPSSGLRSSAGTIQAPSSGLLTANVETEVHRSLEAHYGGGGQQAAPGVGSSSPAPDGRLSSRTEKYIVAVTSALQAHADELGRLDGKTGDGDFGNTVRSGCERIRADLDRGYYNVAAGNPSSLFDLLARSVSQSMGGTSGALTSTFLQAASQSFQRGQLDPRLPLWRTAFVDGTHAVMEQGRAQIGDRTLIDALKPAADVLATPGRSLAEAAREARIGYESTKSMTEARKGRSQNVRPSMLLNNPDPGAYAVWISLNALVEAAFV